MTSDPIHPVAKEEDTSENEKNTEHVEISQHDEKSPSVQWREPKPKLNLQMALAFVVSERSFFVAVALTHFDLGSNNAIQRLHSDFTHPFNHAGHDQRRSRPRSKLHLDHSIMDTCRIHPRFCRRPAE